MDCRIDRRSVFTILAQVTLDGRPLSDPFLASLKAGRKAGRARLKWAHVCRVENMARRIKLTVIWRN
jgi:hypothetical protein